MLDDVVLLNVDIAPVRHLDLPSQPSGNSKRRVILKMQPQLSIGERFDVCVRTVCDLLALVRNGICLRERLHFRARQLYLQISAIDYTRDHWLIQACLETVLYMVKHTSPHCDADTPL